MQTGEQRAYVGDELPISVMLEVLEQELKQKEQFPCLAQTASSYNPGPLPYPGVTLSTVNWVLPLQSLAKKNSHRHAHRQTDWGKILLTFLFLNEFSLSQDDKN